MEPVTGGWLVCPGNLQGVSLAPRPPFVLPTLADVLDYRPEWAVVALHAPVGVMENPGEARPCDLAARRILGSRHGAAVAAPSRKLLQASTYKKAKKIDKTLSPIRWQGLVRSAESIREVQSWRQRAVWEVNPELAFHFMNGRVPLLHSRRTEKGRDERMALLAEKLPGCDLALDACPPGVREGKLLDGLACLWTARRVAARAVVRLSDPPVWDAEGVRMDIVC